MEWNNKNSLEVLYLVKPCEGRGDYSFIYLCILCFQHHTQKAIFTP